MVAYPFPKGACRCSSRKANTLSIPLVVSPVHAGVTAARRTSYWGSACLYAGPLSFYGAVGSFLCKFGMIEVNKERRVAWNTE